MGKSEPLDLAGGNVKLPRHFGKQLGSSSRLHIVYNPVILLLHKCLRGLKTDTQNLYTNVHSILFIILEKKLPKCL